MDTWLLDEAIKNKKTRNEFKRKQLIEKIKTALNKF